MFESVKKFIITCTIMYIILAIATSWLLAIPGNDLIGGTLTYFGFVILSSVILHLSKSKNNEE